MNNVSFVQAVGVAPGTTSLTFTGGNSLGLATCPPSLLPLTVAPDQSTYAAYRASLIKPARWWWFDPASSGTGFTGLGNASESLLFQFVLGAAIGVGLAYGGTYAHRRWRR